MEERKPLDAAKLLEDSRQFRGGLGVLSFTVVRALKAAGAPPAAVKAALDAMVEHFPALSEADCETLCATLHARLSEERGPDGRWYPRRDAST